MAIQIRRKEANNPPVIEPEVLTAGGKGEAGANAPESDVKIPELNDEFLRKSGSMMAWFMEHRRMVLFVALLIVCISFGYYGVKYAQEMSATRTSGVLSPAFVTYTMITKAEAEQIEQQRYAYMKSQGIAAEAKDILHFTETVPDDKTRYLAIEKHLSQHLDAYRGEAIETSGRLMQAGASARLRPADAVTPLYAAAEKSPSSDVKLFAMIGEAEMLVGEKKYDQALMTLENVMNLEPALTSYATLEKGRIYEIEGKKDEAIAAYGQVFREFGQPDDQKKALERLRYLTADWSKQTQVAPVEANPAGQVAM